MNDKTCPKCKGVFSGDSLYCPDDGTPLSIGTLLGEDAMKRDPYLGVVIHGDIEIRQLVGVGAMGRVYRAFQKGVDRFVAVKVLHRELSTNSQIVTRFHREAHVASRLQHPHVVQVYLTGEMPDGAMYIVMEYLDGLSLQSAISASGGGMALTRALHIILQLCDAVGEAHAQGIVHRDLKPENVMLVRRNLDDDFVKVLDFGIARVNWGDQSMATQQGLIFGTARYISPEGAQGEAVGPEGDVYAIATLLYQMLAGETPFDGDQAVSILIRQISDPAPPLNSRPAAAHVPEPIVRTVMKNLAKPKSQRASNARLLGRALLDAIRESGLNPEDLLARPSLLGPPPYAEKAAKPLPSSTVPLPASTAPIPARTAPLPRVNEMRDARGETAKWIPEGARPRLPSSPEPSVTPPVVGVLESPYGPPPAPGFLGAQAAFSHSPQPPSQVLPTVVGAREPNYEPAPLAQGDAAYASEEAPSEMSETMGGERRGRIVTLVTILVCFCVGLVGAGLIAVKYGWLRSPFKQPPVVVATPTVSTPVVPVASIPVPSASQEIAPLPPLAGSATPDGAPRINLTLELFPTSVVVGQTVSFVGKIQSSRPPKQLDSGVFTIRAGSGAPVIVPAQQDATGFRASFTPTAAGAHTVTFSVRFDTFRAQTVRPLVVGGGATGPTPTASVKWM